MERTVSKVEKPGYEPVTIIKADIAGVNFKWLITTLFPNLIYKEVNEAGENVYKV